MGNVIHFPIDRAIQRDSERFLNVSDAIDSVIKNEIQDGRITAQELAGLLAHRLGALMSYVSSEERASLIELCEKIMKQQAGVNRTG